VVFLPEGFWLSQFRNSGKTELADSFVKAQQQKTIIPLIIAA